MFGVDKVSSKVEIIAIKTVRTQKSLVATDNQREDIKKEKRLVAG